MQPASVRAHVAENLNEVKKMTQGKSAQALAGVRQPAHRAGAGPGRRTHPQAPAFLKGFTNPLRCFDARGNTLLAPLTRRAAPGPALPAACTLLRVR